MEENEISGGLDNFVEHRQFSREVRSMFQKRHKDRIADGDVANARIPRRSPGVVAKTEDLVLVREAENTVGLTEGVSSSTKDEQALG